MGLVYDFFNESGCLLCVEILSPVLVLAQVFEIFALHAFFYKQHFGR